MVCDAVDEFLREVFLPEWLLHGANRVGASRRRELAFAVVGSLVEEEGSHEYKASVEVHDRAPKDNGHDLILAKSAHLLLQLEEDPGIVLFFLGFVL